MATRLEIINRALVRLGERPLTTTSDGTSSALRMRTLFPASAGHVANTHSWSELTIEHAITGTLNLRAPLMVDGVARTIIKALDDGPNPLYEVRGGVLSLISSTSNTPAPRISGTLRLLLQPITEPDTVAYGPLFSDAVTARLVYDAAGGRTSILQLLRQEYDSTLATAISQDSQQGNNLNTIRYNYPIITDRD